MSRMLKWVFAGVAAVAMTSMVYAQDQDAEAMAKAEQARLAKEKAAVLAEEAKEEARNPVIFKKMDANRDGQVSAKERQARLQAWFKELDTNGDGKLTPDEFVGQRFANIDRDKDGAVTIEEYMLFFAGPSAVLDRSEACDKLDANGDNIVSLPEFIAYRKSVFAAMNANSDGRVTPDEMKAYLEKQFKSLDANNDGFVTVDEMIAITPAPAAEPKVEEKTADQPAK